MKPTVRDPVAAGTFYPARPADLLRDIERLLDEAGIAADGEAPAATVERAAWTRLLVAPHAALVRSGFVAARAHRAARVAPLVVILSPNQHRVGAPFALPRSGSWRTPLGLLEIEERATEAIFAHAAEGSPLRDDWRAHSRDHATEMQMPFLQVGAARQGSAPPCVVTLACAETERDSLVAAGEALAAALLSIERADASEMLLLVSADLAQSLPAAEVRDEDRGLVELIADCEPEALWARVRGRGLVVGGLPPLIVGLAAARRLGAGAGQLLAHETSAQRGGDPSHAVGYAAIRLAPG